MVKAVGEGVERVSTLQVPADVGESFGVAVDIKGFGRVASIFLSSDLRFKVCGKV